MRTFDSSPVNALLNHPDIFPTIAKEGMTPGDFDCSKDLENPLNVCLIAEGGAIIFLQREPGCYEVHSNFLRPDRARLSTQGPHIQNVCRSAYRWMFTHTDCLVLLTRIPAHNRAALIFSPLVGWVKEFERKNVWPTLQGELVDLAFCAIRYVDWVRKATWLRHSGRAFHRRLEEEFARHARTEPQHPDDEWHDQHVGACVEMILGNQIEKAVALYNVWASFAGYELMQLKSVNPTVIDIGNALLQVVNGTFKVLRVH